MTANESHDRLSGISTRWSLLFEAHQGGGKDVLHAQSALMQRYCGAVYRYLLAVLHDPHAADDLVQEFALRFVRGDFRNVTPERGRFRDYVKTALYHLLVDHHRCRAARPQPLPADSTPLPAVEPDARRHEVEFRNGWREELLNRAWEALAAAEDRAGTPYYAVLRWRAENPHEPAARLADELAARTGKPFTEEGIRQILHRAREQFADLLLEDVAGSLQDGTTDLLEEELAELGLLGYCDRALGRWKARPGGTGG